MNPGYFLIPLVLLLSTCGVSSSQQERMSEDFRDKLTALYLAPGAPGMVEDVKCFDFEKGEGLAGAGFYHASFSASHVGDDGRAVIYGEVGFDEAGRVAFVDSSRMAVFVVMVMKTSPRAEQVSFEKLDDYIPSQISH